MDKTVSDQADGLRRLLGAPRGRLVAVVGSSPGSGATSVALDLAAALSGLGQQALLLDDDRSPAAPAGVLPAGRIAIVDATLDATGALSPLAARADDVLVVLRPQPDALKSAYACIKSLHRRHAFGQLRLLFTQVVDAALARQLAANLVRTGSQYLAVSLLPAGSVTADPQVAQARHLGLAVVEAFPASPAAADVRRLAADLLHWPLRATPAARAA